jgi:transcriptional regulator, gntR family
VVYISLYDELKRKLISMELKPGDKLSENSIAIEKNMSRPKVRNILTGLADEGYLETLPQRGSVVTKINKDMIREATHAHLVLDQAIIVELVNKRKNGFELEMVNSYLDLLKVDKIPKDEYDMVMLEWGFYQTLAKECGKEHVYSFLDKIDCDMYRLSSLKYLTYNYSAHNSALNAWETTVLELKLMTEQLNSCKIDLLTVLCSNRYNGFLANAGVLSGIYSEYFE